jgi:hypothetical protein
VKKNQGKSGQQGAVRREPGQHGDKTRSRQTEIAHSGAKRSREAVGPRYDPEEIRAHADRGAHRLFEDRQQHDEADKNSEKTRLARDADRHHHVRGNSDSKRNVQSIAKRKS